jgi:glycosyltransferase involved in cell wall biosynthesis
MDPEILTTTVIPTVGRRELDRAVASVLEQSPPHPFEVIIVNDSGEPLPPARWQADPRVRLLETDRLERCVARNTGAAAARGVYLHFLDDDDRMLPDGLRIMHEAAGPADGFIYGATRLEDRMGKRLLELEHYLSGNISAQVMCGEWIPLQSALIQKTLFLELGGFHPWQAGAEDIDLVRRAAVRTDFRYVPSPVSAVTMGAAGSTTLHDRQSARSRRGRELILDRAETFPRMLASADSPHWRGGIARIYLTSCFWNLARRKLPTAAHRLLFGLAMLIRSGRHVFAGAFWNAILRPYRSVTFSRAAEHLSQAAG